MWLAFDSTSGESGTLNCCDVRQRFSCSGMVQNSMEMVEEVCVWFLLGYVFSFHFHSFSVLGRCKEAVGHVEGPGGNRIMVVPAHLLKFLLRIRTPVRSDRAKYSVRPCCHGYLTLVFQCVITLCFIISHFFFIYFPLRFLLRYVIRVSPAQKQHKEYEVSRLCYPIV